MRFYFLKKSEEFFSVSIVDIGNITIHNPEVSLTMCNRDSHFRNLTILYYKEEKTFICMVDHIVLPVYCK